MVGTTKSHTLTPNYQPSHAQTHLYSSHPHQNLSQPNKSLYFDLSGPLKIMWSPETPFLIALSYSNPETTSAQEPS